jgi:hypothetical protein
MEWLAWLESTTYATWVRQSRSIWAYPSILTAHTLGLAVLVGGNVALDLALIGRLPGLPLAPLRGLFPVMWAGFWINALSGVSLFMADATTKATQAIFYVKMLCVALGLVNMTLIRRAVFGDETDVVIAPPNAKLLAGTSLLLWASALTAGRLMAYVR